MPPIFSKQLVNYSLTDNLLKLVASEHREDQPFLSSACKEVVVAHLTLATCAVDGSLQLAAAVAKLGTGVFATPINCASRLYCGEYVVENLGWTMAFHHLSQAVKHLVGAVPVYMITLFSNPHFARENFFPGNVEKEKRTQDLQSKDLDYGNTIITLREELRNLRTAHNKALNTKDAEYNKAIQALRTQLTEAAKEHKNVSAAADRYGVAYCDLKHELVEKNKELDSLKTQNKWLSEVIQEKTQAVLQMSNGLESSKGSLTEIQNQSAELKRLKQDLATNVHQLQENVSAKNELTLLCDALKEANEALKLGANEESEKHKETAKKLAEVNQAHMTTHFANFRLQDALAAAKAKIEQQNEKIESLQNIPATLITTPENDSQKTENIALTEQLNTQKNEIELLNAKMDADAQQSRTTIENQAREIEELKKRLLQAEQDRSAATPKPIANVEVLNSMVPPPPPPPLPESLLKAKSDVSKKLPPVPPALPTQSLLKKAETPLQSPKDPSSFLADIATKSFTLKKTTTPPPSPKKTSATQSQMEAQLNSIMSPSLKVKKDEDVIDPSIAEAVAEKRLDEALAKGLTADIPLAQSQYKSFLTELSEQMDEYLDDGDWDDTAAAPFKFSPLLSRELEKFNTDFTLIKNFLNLYPAKFDLLKEKLEQAI